MTMIPPMNGPNAGPIKVPDKNQPMAVARSVGRYMSPMTAAPTIKNAVPSKAVSMRKMKKEARFGERAVPREKQPKRKAQEMDTWRALESCHLIDGADARPDEYQAVTKG